MDPKDLRIGNLVYADGEIAVVVAIDGKEKNDFDIYIGNSHGKVIKARLSTIDIKPILLADKFVAKLGLFDEFGKLKLNLKGENYSLRRQNGHVVLYSSRGESMIHFWEVKYLHRLQNLYYVLSKEELPVDH
ncbi:MAG: hypothetical protein BGO69_16540 [Bacteroidetes bacterium 46-16]|nr:MAG: hypothetical protein BGO69_16540 [Bacteroidetes bacterium 46-16]